MLGHFAFVDADENWLCIFTVAVKTRNCDDVRQTTTKTTSTTNLRRRLFFLLQNPFSSSGARTDLNPQSLGPSAIKIEYYKLGRLSLLVNYTLVC
jgi:hypothetical protein